MNECLNSDDDDEEDHRGLCTSFEYLRGKTCADDVLSGDSRQRALTTSTAFHLIPAENSHRWIRADVFEYSQQNGLIT